MDTNVRYSLAKAKRDYNAMRYGRNITAFNCITKYYISKEQATEFFALLNKWLRKKNHPHYPPFTQQEINAFIKSLWEVA